MVTLPTAKDETDTEAALRLAVDRGATTSPSSTRSAGPRLDHLLGNLLLLTAPWLAPVGVRLVDGLHEAFLVQGDSTVSGRPGDTVSLLPLTPRWRTYAPKVCCTRSAASPLSRGRPEE